MGAGISENETTIDRLDAPAGTEAAAEMRIGPGTALLTDVRVGGHLSYDRVVFEFDGVLPGHRVEYVDRVSQDGSGDPVPLRGRAFLLAIMTPAAAHHDDGSPSFPGPPGVEDLAALRGLAAAGDFEGDVSWGIGLAARTGFRVLRLTGPPRIAVDVAHTPPGTGEGLLRRGDRGAAVATWQWRLRLALHLDLEVDEVFGSRTDAATRDFQRGESLTADGVVGPRTRAAMERALGL